MSKKKLMKKLKPKILHPYMRRVAVFSGKVMTSHRVKRCRYPVIKAKVNVGDYSTITDKRGYFRLQVPASEPKKGNRFVLNIRKHGFGLISKIYTGSRENGLWTMTKATVTAIDPTVNNTVFDIRPMSICTGSLSSQVDWSSYEHRRTPRQVDANGQYIGEASAEVKAAALFAETAETCNGGINVAIPANSLVDSQGKPPSGMVNVSLSTVDIYDPDSMPGDFTTLVEKRRGYMVTYGAGTISIDSLSKNFQLKKGAEVTLTIPINKVQAKRSKELESTIPLLVYDEKNGIWQTVGEAELNKERTAYIGKVRHFSAFNMDLVKTDQSCIRVDSSGINSDYELEIIIPYQADVIIRSVSVDNTPEKIHAIYNLPPNTDVSLRAFRTVGSSLVPITDTVSVNTGPPQNPSTPNNPDYPYNACNGQVALTEQPLAPVLYGSVASDTITLSWDYTFPGGLASTNDGYWLEEDDGGGYTKIHETNNDRSTHGSHTIVRPLGSYSYRIRAKYQGGPSPWSNIVQLSVVDTGPSAPTILRIINDLDNTVDGYGNDWGQLNQIIRVRICSTENEILYTTSGERLYPGETTSDPADLEVIPPILNSDASYMEFDVSGVPLGPDDRYYVFIQVGWWDAVFNPNPPYDFWYYQKKNSNVLDCDNNCCVEKWAYIGIEEPFGDPEILRASLLLPDGHWSEVC